MMPSSVLLTGQRCNRSWRYCGLQRHSTKFNENALKREGAPPRPKVTGLTLSSETLAVRKYHTISAKRRRDALIDIRKEKCVGMGLGPVLAPQPQMVAPDEALPARANIRIPIIISQFHGLIHPTVTVSQVGRLRRPQVGSKTFLST
jgi:hypothetical protein